MNRYSPPVAALTMHQWLKLGRELETSRTEQEQCEIVLDIFNLMLGLGLEADAHNPLLEAKGLLESALEEMIFEDRADLARANYADFRNDEIRNDRA